MFGERRTLNRCLLAILVLLIAACLLSSSYSTSAQSSNSTATISVVNAVTGSNVTSGSPGDDFTINITISNVTDMAGYQFGFSWNASLLNCTQGFLNQTSDHWQWYPSQDPSIPPTAWGSSVFTALDNMTFLPGGIQEYNLTVLSLSVLGISGNFTVAALSFDVKGIGQTPLTLGDVVIGESENPGTAIPCYAISGLFRNNSVPEFSTTIPLILTLSVASGMTLMLARKRRHTRT